VGFSFDDEPTVNSKDEFTVATRCINMHDRVQDDKITPIFETVANLRKEYERKATRK